MMTFKEFEKYMNALQAFDKWIDDLDNLGINIWENETVAHMLTYYKELLDKQFNLPSDPLFGTELDYFIWETNYGRLAEEYDVPYSNLKEFYDYITKE